MNLVKYYEDSETECFINMDFIECVNKEYNGKYRVCMIGSEKGYEISESAYNTILKYGKAEI